MDHLAFLYQVIIASELLLQEGAFLLKDEGWEAELKAFYLKHLGDERHHAEWLKEDLGDQSIVLHYGAAQLAGMAYYLIRHVHPVALMGYMQALEGNPMPIEYVESIEKQFGVKAGRTLRIHAENDPGHIEELRAFPIPPEWKPLVENTRLQTIQLIKGL